MSKEAQEWNEVNKFHIAIANKLLTLVNQYEKESHWDTIVDIGSGSGNITQMMAQTLSHRKIYGLDVDVNMVKFSKESCNDESIEYVLADLSGDWDSQDHETMKNLESKVSMVFSNMCIHLMKDKLLFIKNLKRLLTKDSLAYFSIPLLPYSFTKLNEEEKAIFEPYIKIPTENEQEQFYTNLFNSNGFKIEYKEFEYKILSNITKRIVIALIPFLEIWLSTYVLGGLTLNDLPEDIKKRILYITCDSFSNWRESSVNWNIVDEVKTGSLEENVEDFKWTIAYIVCRSE